MNFFIVPHSQLAAEQHDYGIEDPDVMTIISVDGDKIDFLWEIGFFDNLNKTFGLMIATGEDEKILGQELLKKVLIVTDSYIENYLNSEILNLFRALLEEAIQKNTELNIYLT